MHGKHDVLSKYLAVPAAHKKSRHCGTCAMEGEVHEAIALFLTSVETDRKAGRIPHTIVGFHEVLTEHYGYEMTTGALINHLRRCLHVKPF